MKDKIYIKRSVKEKLPDRREYPDYRSRQLILPENYKLETFED